MLYEVITQFAQELKLPPKLLLEQLKAAGVSKNDVVDPVTNASHSQKNQTDKNNRLVKLSLSYNFV